MTIKLLDEKTISKIAAGEIIENPASIIKELLENSIDANSKNIVIETRGEACDFLRITDDGIGMSKEDLEVAFLRHSTSKLSSVEDLNNIVSLGFRGEALASISHISKVTVMTKTAEDAVGTRVEVENGKIIKSNSIGMPKGTTFIIKDIFYNTPVRKKYLKQNNTELNYILDVIQKIALGTPNVSIKYIKDNKTVLNTLGNNDVKSLIYSILGNDISSNLNKISFKSQSYTVTGFISNNRLYRSNRNHHYVYVNGRYVKNLEISKTIEKYYQSLIPLNRYPVFILYIDMDPILVDVNIHPKKHEIKFSKDNNIIAIIADLIDENLYPNRVIINPLKMDKPLENKDTDITTQENIFEMFNSEDDQIDLENENFNLNTKFIDIDYVPDKVISKIENRTIIASDEETSYDIKNELRENSSISKDILEYRIVGILFKTYIILEDFDNSKFYLIDQHAAHERILYEKYKKQYESSSVIRQILLTPEILSLSAMEKDNIENNKEIFNSLGFDIEDFGETDIVIREVPMLFGLAAYKNFIYDLINNIKDIKSGYSVDPYKIMKKACKAAIKAGDSISILEIKALLSQLVDCDNAYTCPHGRPTITEFTYSDINKLFLRE